jgi:hypothetical protein
LRPAFLNQLERIEARAEAGMARPTDEADFAKMQVDLRGPEFPEGSEYLYRWFCEASRGRGSNGWGPNTLTAVEIAAWARLAGHRLTPWEFSILRALDGEWLGVYSELNKPDPPKKKAVD